MTIAPSAAEEPPRPLPALDADTAFFWQAGNDGHLLIQRCRCGHYQHPPLPRCPRCGSQELAPVPVSGRGQVASFTVNRQQWRAGLTVPYVFAAVELEEQAALFVFTNIIDCPVENVRIGMPVDVTFEAHGDVFLPMFRPQGGHDG